MANLGGGSTLGGPNTSIVTVAQLIAGAFRLLGTLAAGESPTAEEQNNAMLALNDLIDSWANERLTLYATSRDTYTLTAGHNPHTIGTEGSPDFNATRPVRIDRASLVLATSGNSELPIRIVSDHEWQVTQGKVTTGKPVFLWVESAYPLMKLWLNPMPSAADTLVLYTWKQVGRFATVTTNIDLPPGYARAIRYGLALELAPEYGVEPSSTLVENAAESLAQLKRGNIRPNYLFSDSAVVGGGRFNIISGDK